jgi:hypothetical protein
MKKCNHDWNVWDGSKYGGGMRWYRKCKKCGEMCATNLEDGFPPDEIWEKM